LKSVTKIDPTARVDKGARVGTDVEIGPYCVVGPEVTLADGCRLVAQVYVAGRASIGPRTVVWPFAALGTPPQSVHYKGEASRLVIGADCVIREGVTMSTGTAGGRMETRVGDRCMLMANVHVAHDCTVGSDVIFANAVMLGGHAVVEDHVFMGGGAAVHQHMRVGAHAVVGGLTGIWGDMIPFGAAKGDRARLVGLNVVGLRRRGFSNDVIRTLRRAYDMLFAQTGELVTRIDQVAAEFAGDENVMRIVAFARESKRRPLITPHARGESEDD
jgi:UDP-N-acetylglucosamine acyltransferase